MLNKKLKLGILVSCLVSSVSCFMSSCNYNSQKVANDSPIEVKVENNNNNDSKNHKEDNNLYSYASHLNLSEEELENLLTIKENDKEYKLIPANNSEEHKNFWCDLLTTNHKYMQTFFLNRKLPSKARAEYEFKTEIDTMWKKSKPDSLFFFVMLNGEYCGIIESACLVNGDTTFIGYVTKEEYAGQGVATNSLKIFINFIRHLNETGFYNVSEFSVWIFDSNLASISVAKKNGFVYEEADTDNMRSRYVLKL